MRAGAVKMLAVLGFVSSQILFGCSFPADESDAVPATTTVGVDVTVPPIEPQIEETPSVDLVGLVSTAEELQSAVDAAQPGDTITIAGGSYEMALDVHGVDGTFDQPVVVRAEAGSRVTISAPIGADYALFVHSSSHIVIGSGDADLEFVGSDGMRGPTVAVGLVTGTAERSATDDRGPVHHLTMVGLDIRNGGFQLLRIGQHSSRIALVDSLLSSAGLTEPDFGEGVYLGSATGEDLTREIVLRDVVIEETTAEAIDIKGGVENIVIDGLETRAIVLSSLETNTKCAIAHRGGRGGLELRNSTISGVQRAPGVDPDVNEPCGVYTTSGLSISDTRISGNEGPGLWVNSGDELAWRIRITGSDLTGNNPEESPIRNGGEEVVFDIVDSQSGNAPSSP